MVEAKTRDGCERSDENGSEKGYGGSRQFGCPGGRFRWIICEEEPKMWRKENSNRSEKS